MSQNLAPSLKYSTMLPGDQESEASVLAGGDLDMGAGFLGDRLTSTQRFTFAESVRIVLFPFFVWHVENLGAKVYI